MRESSVIALTVDNAFSRFIDAGCDARCGTERTTMPKACEEASGNLAKIVKNDYYARSFCCHSRKPGFSMANTAQAKKRARQAEATRKRNASLKSALRSAVKNVKKAIAAGDKAAAMKEFQAQQSVIDRVADKKVVHKNLASRSKHRLANAIKSMA